MSAQAISTATLDRIIGGIEKSHVCRMEHEGEWCSQCEKVNAAKAELRQIRDALDSAAAANAEHERFVADVLHIRGEIERTVEDLERCRAALRLVMEWWAAHEFDAIPLGDGDERNAYDEEPAMVKAAREALK